MSLSPSMSVQNNMLPEKMAFWNLFIPALTEPGPTMVPSSSPVTRATISPTGEKEAAVGKGKSSWIYDHEIMLSSVHTRPKHV